MAEIAGIREWIATQLEGSSDITDVVNARIWPDNARNNPTFPYVVFHSVTPIDLPVFGDGPGTVRSDWLVKAVGEGRGYDVIEPLADAIHAALNRQSGSVTGYEIVGCYRTAPFSMPEQDEGKEWRHLGGYYRITLQEAAP